MTIKRSAGSIQAWSSPHMFVKVYHDTGDIRKRVVDAHQARNGYKTICKEFGPHQSTVGQIVYKWRKFKTIVDQQRSLQEQISEVPNDPRGTSKQLKVSLTLANINVQESTIRRTLNNKARMLLENCFIEGWEQNRTFWFKWEALWWEKGKHCIPAYVKCETWWW